MYQNNTISREEDNNIITTLWETKSSAHLPERPMGKPVSTGETVLIYNANLIDVRQGKFFNETALYLQGEKIVNRILDSEDKSITADRKINAGGRYIIPGIINAHVHMTAPPILTFWSSLKPPTKQIYRGCADCIRHGVTTVRDLWSTGGLQTTEKLIKRVKRGSLMGPRIIHAIPVQIKKGYPLGNLDFSAGNAIQRISNVSEVKDAVSKIADLGVDQLKLFIQPHYFVRSKIMFIPHDRKFPLMTEEMYEAAVEKARGLGMKIAVHVTTLDGLKIAIQLGVDTIEHCVTDELVTDRELKTLSKGEPAIVPTLSVPYGMLFPVWDDKNFKHPNVQKMFKDREETIYSQIDRFTAPRFAKTGKAVYEKWKTTGYLDKEHFAITPVPQFFNRAVVIGSENVKRMYTAGCTIGCGNDGNMPFMWSGSMAVEMQLMQYVLGMSPEDVLRSATSTNADIIGLGDLLGAIEPGKVADLVILDANPLESMSSISRVAAVLQSSRLVYTAGSVIEYNSYRSNYSN